MRGRPYIGGLTRSPVGGRHDPPVARRRGDRPSWRAHWPVAPGVGDRGLSPVGGATGPALFFLQICNKVSGKKKCKGACRPPTGDRGLSPTPGATGSLPPIYKPWSSFTCHLSLNFTKKEG